MHLKTININGNNFSDIDGFYNEVERVFTKDLGWRIGRNLDAFEDILYGTGYGVFEVGESIKLIWENCSKSKIDLGFEETKKFYETKIINKNIAPENRQYFKEKLEDLLNYNGQTFFDIILEIISERKNIEFEIDTEL